MTIEKWRCVARIADIAPGDGRTFDVGGSQVALFNVDGDFHCVSAVCTHGHALLSDGFLDGHVIECPLHGGCFDIRNGKAIATPAEIDLATYPVMCRDGDILVSVGEPVKMA